MIDRYVWSPLVPLKVSIFVWRLLRRWLQRDDILQDKGQALCSKCNRMAQKAVCHLFLHGLVATNVSQHFFKIFGLLPDTVSSIASMLNLQLLSYSIVSNSHVRVLIPLLVLWFVWKGKNLARFQADSFTSAQVIFQIEEFLGQIGRVNLFTVASFICDSDCPWLGFGRPHHRKIRIQLVFWSQPSLGCFKLNTDTSMVQMNVAFYMITLGR